MSIIIYILLGYRNRSRSVDHSRHYYVITLFRQKQNIGQRCMSVWDCGWKYGHTSVSCSRHTIKTIWEWHYGNSIYISD